MPSQDGGGDEPVFDAEAYRQAAIDNRYDDTADITREFQEAVEAWQNSGGSLTVDALREAVLAFMASEHNVQSTDGSHFVIKPEQVQVRAPGRLGTEAGLWVIQMAPTWG